MGDVALLNWMSPNVELCKFYYHFRWGFSILTYYFFLVGLGWRPDQKDLLQQENTFSDIDVCQIKLKFMFYKDHTDEMFTVPVAGRTGNGSKRFTFFLLHLNDNNWQSFQCPMDFSQCNYNWCVIGENKLVSN
jgi:hypothetical protein